MLGGACPLPFTLPSLHLKFNFLLCFGIIFFTLCQYPLGNEIFILLEMIFSEKYLPKRLSHTPQCKLWDIHWKR